MLNLVHMTNPQYNEEIPTKLLILITVHDLGRVIL